MVRGTGRDELAHHVAREVRRNREADAIAATRGREYLRIDADQFSTQVHERTAGIARIDRRVGLDEVLDAAPAEASTVQARDDARTRGLAYADLGRKGYC